MAGDCGCGCCCCCLAALAAALNASMDAPPCACCFSLRLALCSAAVSDTGSAGAVPCRRENTEDEDDLGASSCERVAASAEADRGTGGGQEDAEDEEVGEDAAAMEEKPEGPAGLPEPTGVLPAEKELPPCAVSAEDRCAGSSRRGFSGESEGVVPALEDTC